MIHDLPLRWVVTVLFALSAAECGLPIITVRRPWTLVVGHGLHCAMAVAMATMAWPWATRLPTTGPVAFFLLATVWFAVMALRAAPTTAVRVRYGYHAIMIAGDSLDVCRHVNAGHSHDRDEHAGYQRGTALVQRGQLAGHRRLRGRGGVLDIAAPVRPAAMRATVQLAGRLGSGDDGRRDGCLVLGHAFSDLGRSVELWCVRSSRS
ncbi:DUF5134 domain-containing protein [Mycobacterium ulcerans]|uniref:DUF5134 domain-containing protein n=1 Tax=Mycobacterium ulcerans TaxID=1809 RepID=UPI003F503DAA